MINLIPESMCKNCRIPITSLLTIIIIVVSHFCNAQQENWTHFRGNSLDGISASDNPVISWDNTSNILWKTNIEGKGWSSPVIYGDQVWITTATEDGKIMKGICLGFSSGKIIYDLPLFSPDSVQTKHVVNTYATPTPCIEEGSVYLHFGTYGTACVNTANGKTVWKRTDINCEHVQGPGSSPILYKNMLILHLEGVDVQYLIALDKRTGKTIWKTERPANLYEPLAPIGKKAYITPIIVNVDGKDLLISNGSAVCIAYDPETGREIWRIIQGVDSTISMPFIENGIVYFYSSFVVGSDGEKHIDLIAVNPKGQGNIASTNILWRFESPILQLLTPLIKNGLMYTIDTQNTLFCLNAKNGQVVYSKKLKSKYNSSPVWAAGKIYFTSIKGETLVLDAGRTLNIIAENKIPGEVYATPAIVRNKIFLRTDKSLYCIGK
jgi:outer membrane protein assembly factor BamB